jgi:hypothetical protein
MIDQYNTTFGNKPCEYTSAFEKGYHPEVEVTEELNEDV